MANTSLKMQRKLLHKRHRSGFGYSVFYSFLLAGFTIALTFLLSAYAGSIDFAIPRFLYDSVTGIVYNYNAIALALMWLTALLFPRPYKFSGLLDNSWNMLYKFGVKPAALAFGQVRNCIVSQLSTYAGGFLLTLLFAFVKSSDKSLDFRLLVMLGLVGVFSVLIIITPAIAAGALSRSGLLLRLAILLSGAVVLYLLYRSDYFNCADVTELTASTGNLISLNLLGLVVIGILFTIFFPVVALSSASARAKDYKVEELEDDALMQLGVEHDILVLEPGRSRYHIAISGPDIHDADVDIPLPPLNGQSADDEPREQSSGRAAKKEKPPKQRKKRGRVRDEEDEEDSLDFDEYGYDED